MAYLVHTFDDVEAYLHNLEGISPAGVGRVIDAYLRDLGERADELLQQEPLEHESYLFFYRYVLLDRGRVHSFRFVVDGSAMPFGVVQVIYVDCESKPASGFPGEPRE